MALCYSCHKIGKQGINVGPELTTFGKTQPREVLIDALLNPSATIAIGYDAVRLETKDGVMIDGILLSKGDPTEIRGMGGIQQSISEDKIKSIQPLGRSLMFAPESLGLSAQAIADLVSYLKSDLIQ